MRGSEDVSETEKGREVSETKKRARRIFGRRKVVVDSVEYRVELRSEHVTVRPKYGRGEWRLSLVDLVNESLGQKTFRF